MLLIHCRTGVQLPKHATPVDGGGWLVLSLNFAGADVERRSRDVEATDEKLNGKVFVMRLTL
jgi:hypothetical protein